MEISRLKKEATSRELILHNYPDFKIIIGTENKKSPKAVYALITTWVNTNMDLPEDYINNLNKHLQRMLFNEHDDFVFEPKRNIVILEYASPNKYIDRSKHYLTIDLTFFQENRFNPIEWSDYNLQLSIEYYIERIIEELKSRNELNFSPSRKVKKGELIFN